MPEEKKLGIALDIGTTTLASALVELETGRVLDSASAANPQAEWGSDVVSRLKAVIDDPGALEKMRSVAAEALEGLIEGLGAASAAGVATVAAAGNSVMEHIFLGISPEPMARPPFKPAWKTSRTVQAEDVGLKCLGGAPVFVFPLVGGFVGGDAVAVMLSLGFGPGGAKGAENVLAIDLGTNSEIILSTPEGVFAAAAAAGPAFEGGNLASGMRAQRGAIRGVRTDGESLELDVIGGVAPRGVCGSGLVDAVAALLSAGVIEPSGRIRPRDEIPSNLSSRIKEGEGGNSVVLHRGAAGEVLLTQEDVRALQTAKAAIRAGVDFLLDRAGIGPEELDEVFLAGAFGSGIDKGSFSAIGVLDPGWLGKTSVAGNAALDGAALALLSEEAREKAETLADETRYVSLSGSARFEKEFIRNMDF